MKILIMNLKSSRSIPATFRERHRQDIFQDLASVGAAGVWLAHPSLKVSRV